MRSRKMRVRATSVGWLCGLGTLFQLGGCDLGTINTTTTLDGREALIQLLRGAILGPIDAFITTAVNQVLGADEA